MTRRRRLSPVSRVCIGTLLLLFSVAAADTIKGPPTILEKAHSTEDETTIQKNRTILSKVEQADALESSLENSGRVVGEDKNLEDAPDDVPKNAKTDPELERTRSTADKDVEVQGIRSHEEVGSLTSNSSNGGSKFEEIPYGSGKSSSTKAVSEDFYRSSRTNGLTTVTTKPGLEEPASRLEDRRGRLTANPETRNNTRQNGEEKETSGTTNGTAAKTDSLDPSAPREEKREEINAQDASRSGRLSISSNLEAKVEGVERERESTTPRGVSRESGDRERKKKIAEEIESKHSEVSDLESAAEKSEGAEAISLINDTYVNYSPRNESTAGRSAASGNGTNLISEDDAVSHGRLDPKEEVEVVENVTHTPIQRIVTGGQPPENRSSSIDTKDKAFDSKLERSESSADDNFDSKKHDAVNVAANKTEGTGSTGEEQQGGKKDLKLVDVASNEGGETKNEEDDSTSQNNTSPIPRGRTIGFSGANEFPSSRTKGTAVSSKEIDAPLSKKTTANKTLEQKPYPYAKSTKEPTTEADPRSNGQETTEETSAYENTIGRGESEKKIIVTEPSVVLENSIQQFRPTYYEKTKNGSSNSSTTESEPSSSMTTISSADVKPTNQTVIDETRHGESKKAIDGKPESESKLADENDVPRGNEGSKVITGKDESFDVTGNGITEVSLKQETLEGADKRTSFESTFQQTDVVNGTTEAALVADEKPQTDGKMLSNMDLQTDAEESLLIRSTLNVTEVSTEYSLTRENLTEKSTDATPMENTTVVPTMTPSNFSDETSTLSISVNAGSLDANGTNEIPSGSAMETASPEEIPATTATSVEFEFIGLTEATVFPNVNATEPSTAEERANATEKTTTPYATTVQQATTKNYTMEDATVTIDPETFTENSSTTDGMETTSFDENSTIVSQTTVPIPSLTSETREESTTNSTLDDRTDRSVTRDDDLENTTKSATESSSTTTEESVTTINTEEPFVPLVTKDSSAMVNSTSMSRATMATADITKSSTPIPFTTSSIRPRIFVSSTWSTPSTSGDVPTEATTDVIQTLSSDEITSLVRIVMKGSLHEVCEHLETLRDTLAGILKSGMNKSVYPKQIMIHQNRCPPSPSPTPTPTDVPLTSIFVYVVDENGKFDSAMTNILPTLYNASSINFPVTETDPGNAIAVIVVSSVAFICLILLAGLLFIMRKRQTRFNYGERCRPVSLDAYSLDSVSAYNSVRRKGAARSSKRSYGNPTFEDSSAIPSHPLNFAGLSSFCNDVNAINEEFSGIPQVSAKIDELPAGAEVKNRYANVIPLPETRVPLQKMNNDPLTEYINASYVRGPKNATRYYIACQGPMEATVTDFWRMIWEQQCKVIIMLTDLVENGVEKCTEYIPPSEVTDCHRLYGDYQVTLKKRETKEKYAISTLHLKNLENNTFREVYHIWYLWPVNGVQSDGAGLIAVLLEARALQRGGPGPIVVHCSPGTGRTGTLIALDLGIRQYEITRTVDVPRVVYTIRRDRAGAVQTKEQYAFIYKALNLYATKLAGGVLEST